MEWEWEWEWGSSGVGRRCPCSEDALATTSAGRHAALERRVSSPIMRMDWKVCRGEGERSAARRRSVKKRERRAVAKRRVVLRGGMLGGKECARGRRARRLVRRTVGLGGLLLVCASRGGQWGKGGLPSSNVTIWITAATTGKVPAPRFLGIAEYLNIPTISLRHCIPTKQKQQ